MVRLSVHAMSGYSVNAIPLSVLFRSFLKLCRCLVHGMNMYIRFGHILTFFFIFFQLSHFWHLRHNE